VTRSVARFASRASPLGMTRDEERDDHDAFSADRAIVAVFVA
jgi:hypothetical protein